MSKVILVNGQNVELSADAQTSGTGYMKVPDLAGGTKFHVPAASAAHAAEVAKLGVHGADIASASTTNLETATGELVDVTGTTTITAITLSEGHRRIVRFTGILTLTHGASLVLPGAANITTAAGDVAVFEGYASGVVRCVGYMRAAVAPFNPASPGPIGATNPAAISGTTGAFSGAVTAGNFGRASLSGNVARTSDATLTNTGLSALDVPVVAGERYRLSYRLWITVAGTSGWQVGFSYPAMTAMDGVVTKSSLIIAEVLNITEGFPNWPTNNGTGSGDAIIDSSTSNSDSYAFYDFTFDIVPSASGTFSLLFGQSATGADASTLRRNSCVEWVKF